MHQKLNELKDGCLDINSLVKTLEWDYHSGAGRSENPTFVLANFHKMSRKKGLEILSPLLLPVLAHLGAAPVWGVSPDPLTSSVPRSGVVKPQELDGAREDKRDQKAGPRPAQGRGGGGAGPGAPLPVSPPLLPSLVSRLAGLPQRMSQSFLTSALLHSPQTEEQPKAPQLPAGPSQGHQTVAGWLQHRDTMGLGPPYLAPAPGSLLGHQGRPGSTGTRGRPGLHSCLPRLSPRFSCGSSLDCVACGGPYTSFSDFLLLLHSTETGRGDAPDPALIKMQTTPEHKESGSMSRRRLESLVSRGSGGCRRAA